MAYNNYFPTGYQPYYQQTAPTQQINNGITWVQGEAGAKSYLVAPNSTVTLWDSESQTIYLKSADPSGLPSMKILDYTIRSNAPQETVSDAHSDFATKVDVESIRKDIEALKSQYSLLTKKGDEADE